MLQAAGQSGIHGTDNVYENVTFLMEPSSFKETENMMNQSRQAINLTMQKIKSLLLHYERRLTTHLWKCLFVHNKASHIMNIFHP